MGSNGEGSQINERSTVTVQVQLKNGRKISIQTELDQTVEELKQALANQTGILSDNQWLVHTGRVLSNQETLRSYEMDLDKSIRLFHIGSAPPSTSTGSMPRESTPTPLTETSELDNIESGYEVPKVACMYYAQSGIPHGTEQNQFQLGLMGFSFVETSGKGSESSNANWSESAPNTEPLPNPWAASSYKGGSLSRTEQVPDSILPDRGASSSQTEQVLDSDDELMNLSYWQQVHKRSVDILVPIILSDATL
ncbi:Ubiquitin domain-containing protein DSK2b [Carex littledalei]|uniref:Ubiquitin domain-containing protein DSK2b n=1 Tax=Carex littledalei TaxID=544730 RepID=A0A833R0U7_9POAL|nr:Ubiquitin domain-containing protein DSK2b [Carex littledalei]